MWTFRFLETVFLEAYKEKANRHKSGKHFLLLLFKQGRNAIALQICAEQQ